MRYPWKLNYWNTGEWQVCNERLHDMEKAHVGYNPRRSYLFSCLRILCSTDVKVVLLGQDPYPAGEYCTGTAFSIPAGIPQADYPATLKILFGEYQEDLGYPNPSSGDLTKWQNQGVLLWNVVPTCTEGKSLSHDWEEYSYLTKEIIERLDEQGCIFCFLGGVARRFREIVTSERSACIETSHPSPRGLQFGKLPFRGSKIFTKINDLLVNQGKEKIDWRLE